MFAQDFIVNECRCELSFYSLTIPDHAGKYVQENKIFWVFSFNFQIEPFWRQNVSDIQRLGWICPLYGLIKWRSPFDKCQIHKRERLAGGGEGPLLGEPEDQTTGLRALQQVQSWSSTQNQGRERHQWLQCRKCILRPFNMRRKDSLCQGSVTGKGKIPI